MEYSHQVDCHHSCLCQWAMGIAILSAAFIFIYFRTDTIWMDDLFQKKISIQNQEVRDIVNRELAIINRQRTQDNELLLALINDQDARRTTHAVCQ